uniref:Probable purine permease n=1 Tax=Aegilops tauschii TaxID=37682 RepID=R7W7P8_AEGTA
MAEAVRGCIRPEPSSVCNDTLYSGMNSGSWHQARTSAGEEKGGLSGSMWSEAGVGAVWTPAKPSDQSIFKARPQKLDELESSLSSRLVPPPSSTPQGPAGGRRRMEKDGDGGDGLRHHAIRLPLTAMEGSDSEITSNGGPSVSLRQKASSLMASSAAAYRSKPASFWALLALSGGAMLTAFPAASLLSRLYYNGGGQSKWILSWSAVAGWPIPALLLLPCYLFGDASPTWPPSPWLCFWYALLGLLSAADNLMYAWAYEYLPASTASLVAASSLAFSAVFGRLIVGKKNRIGLSTLNAIVVITAGVVIIALDSGSDRYPGITGRQYALGVALDLGVLGATGVVYLGSTVLAGVLNAVRVPLTSVAAVVWFHDPMSGFKILSLVITVWGFGSYMVGHSSAKKTARERGYMATAPSVLCYMATV